MKTERPLSNSKKPSKKRRNTKTWRYYAALPANCPLSKEDEAALDRVKESTLMKMVSILKPNTQSRQLRYYYRMKAQGCCVDCGVKCKGRWCEKHRQHHREFQAKRYAKNKASGGCVSCSNKAEPGKARCARCLEKYKTYVQRAKDRYEEY